ncbi:alpha/beta hydrolase [Paenibacillus sp. FSL W7-1287]|uniref:alpha/beta hydrolase n=1 Tax=Paenibacillus sp. FSL W7-1287 TaxID=2954538 RepID=UPI0030F9548B
MSRAPLQTNTPIPSFKTTRKSKLTHFSVASTVSLLAFISIIVIVSHAIIAWNLAFPYVPPLESNPSDKKDLSYEVIVYPSRSGNTTVDSWFIPARSAASGEESGQTIILSHGYGANREESWVPMYDLAELMHELGYNVIMFDYGYASKSYSAPATWGSEEKNQLLAAVDYAKERGADRIIVWGFSMGGGTALQAALETEHIDGLILDSLFLPSPETLYTNIKQYIGLPKYPTTSIIGKLLPLWTNHSFSNTPAETILETTYDIPLFIIHGTADNKADVYIAERIAANQTLHQSRLWVIEGGMHELLFRKDPNQYMKNISQFISSF